MLSTHAAADTHECTAAYPQHLVLSPSATPATAPATACAASPAAAAAACYSTTMDYSGGGLGSHMGSHPLSELDKIKKTARGEIDITGGGR